MKLAYRIAANGILLPDSDSVRLGVSDYRQFESAARHRLKGESASILRCPALSLDNVARFYAEHPRSEWRMREDIPNWAPPFQTFFVEWAEPDLWNINGKIERTDDEGQAGFFVMAAEITDDLRPAVAGWRQLMAVWMGCSLPTDESDWFSTGLRESRWLLCCDLWTSCNRRPVCGRAVWAGLQSFLFIDVDGRCVSYGIGGVSTACFTSESRNAAVSPLHILGLGLSFCHCKNVSRIEQTAAFAGRWKKGEPPLPRMRYYVLNIDPMREILRREGRSEEISIQRALHICRGHFATYAPEHPLFGKYVGTFWRPDHVRGSAEQGRVVKDYNVSSGGNS